MALGRLGNLALAASLVLALLSSQAKSHGAVDALQVCDQRFERIITRLKIRDSPGSQFDQSCTDLKGLSLTSVDLDYIPDNTFYSLSSLESLDLSGLGLTSLSDDALAGLGGLTSLDLSGNNLRSLPYRFTESLTNLTELNLCGNPVTSLPPDLLAMDTLRRVCIGNWLESEPDYDDNGYYIPVLSDGCSLFDLFSDDDHDDNDDDDDDDDDDDYNGIFSGGWEDEFGFNQEFLNAWLEVVTTLEALEETLRELDLWAPSPMPWPEGPLNDDESDIGFEGH